MKLLIFRILPIIQQGKNHLTTDAILLLVAMAAVFKMGHPAPFSLFFRIFKTVDSEQMLADD